MGQGKSVVWGRENMWYGAGKVWYGAGKVCGMEQGKSGIL